MHLPDLPSVYFHPWRRESMARLAALKDIHKGERAFIIGNGPSLKQTDLGKLKGEFTFGLNRIYLMFPELGFQHHLFCLGQRPGHRAVPGRYSSLTHAEISLLALAPVLPNRSSAGYISLHHLR